eukprot:6907135-Prorocentrum_lima.AAC.1
MAAPNVASDSAIDPNGEPMQQLAPEIQVQQLAEQAVPVLPGDVTPPLAPVMPPIPEALVEERETGGASTPSESPVTAGIALVGELEEEVAAQTAT